MTVHISPLIWKFGLSGHNLENSWKETLQTKSYHDADLVVIRYDNLWCHQWRRHGIISSLFIWSHLKLTRFGLCYGKFPHYRPAFVDFLNFVQYLPMKRGRGKTKSSVRGCMHGGVYIYDKLSLFIFQVITDRQHKLICKSLWRPRVGMVRRLHLWRTGEFHWIDNKPDLFLFTICVSEWRIYVCCLGRLSLV